MVLKYNIIKERKFKINVFLKLKLFLLKIFK